MASHPDFQAEWCQKILAEPSVEIYSLTSDKDINAMFTRTLHNPEADAIRAQINFSRARAACVSEMEYNYLLSIGPGIDGLQGRAHGGFNALVLDNVTGTCAALIGDTVAPATARLEIDYVRPVGTPGVVLARAWATERTGRKKWVDGTIEDAQGNVLAKGRALYIDAKRL